MKNLYINLDDLRGYFNHELTDEAADVIERLIAEVVSYQEQLRNEYDKRDWISVENRLPRGESGNYMTYRPNAPLDSKVSSLWFDPMHNGWSGNVAYKVTHWMPLPALPEKV